MGGSLLNSLATFVSQDLEGTPDFGGFLGQVPFLKAILKRALVVSFGFLDSKKGAIFQESF